MALFSRDLTQQIPTTGISLVGANAHRKWMGFVNEGPETLDLLFIDPRDGASVTGRIRLGMHGSAVFDTEGGGMRWDGPLSAASLSGTPTLAGVEVEEWA